jgi:hypothetical protein
MGIHTDEDEEDGAEGVAIHGGLPYTYVDDEEEEKLIQRGRFAMPSRQLQRDPCFTQLQRIKRPTARELAFEAMLDCIQPASTDSQLE